MIISVDARLQARKPHCLGLQVSSGMDNEVSVSGTGRRYRAPVSRVAARDSDEQGDDDLCGIHQPGSCAYANKYSAAAIGFASGAVSEGEEFAQIAVGLSQSTQAILGTTFVGSRLLGIDERQRHG